MTIRGFLTAKFQDARRARYFTGGGSYGSTTGGGGGGALRLSTNQQMATANAMTITALADFQVLPGSVLGIHEIADALGEFKIEIREAALAVGREDDAHLRVADVYVGMMVVFLREFGDAIHEVD